MTAGLFATDITAEQRMLFSPAFRSFGIDPSSAFEKALAAGTDAMAWHNSILQRGEVNKFGVFRFRENTKGTGNRIEARLSLCFTSALSQFFSALGGKAANALFGAREQIDDSKNSQDFVINRVVEGGTLQAAIIEFAAATGDFNDNKEAQLFTYVLNNLHSLPSGKTMLILGVSFLQLAALTPAFQVFGYYDMGGQKYGVVPITGEIGVTAMTLANLFYSLTEFALALNKSVLPSVNDLLTFPAGSTGGVCMLNGEVRAKVFNYIDFYPLRLENGGRGVIPPAERRTPVHAMTVLPDCSHIHCSYGMDIIMWPNIAGGHDPCHSDCVAACIQHLAAAHTKGVWHCDLHLGNFVFNPDDPSSSCIIDWDHSRLANDPGCYVPGWQQLTERHAGALPGCDIRLVHERYSLGKVLERFKCENTDFGEQWRVVCVRAADVNVSVVQVANEVSAMKCKLQLIPGDDIVVTGSPLRVLPSPELNIGGLTIVNEEEEEKTTGI
jgi:hypothetical protein